MTKVQLQFMLIKPLNKQQMLNLADTSAVYGILGLKLDPALSRLTVEFDATRLKQRDVEAALGRVGIAVQPIA